MKKKTTMNTTAEHKVCAEDFERDQIWQQLAGSTTVDRTQRKTLWGQVGERRWKVERRYYECVKNVNAVEVVYEGDDLREVIRLYNGLG